MRKFIYLFLISITFIIQVKAQFEPVAVIELFTSQGCSSCPPADKLLSKTIVNAKEKKIFALSFHVDYWNRLGWTDPFSDKKYSQRQANYVSAMNLNSAYTPQMVVNGSYEFTGSDENSLTHALNQSLNTKATVGFKSLNATTETDKTIHVKYVLDGSFVGSTIHFALVSLSETTAIKNGENEGRTLKNEHVVRQFISAKPNATGEIDFAFPSTLKKDNVAIVAYVQRNNDLKIIGAATTNITKHN